MIKKRKITANTSKAGTEKAKPIARRKIVKGSEKIERKKIKQEALGTDAGFHFGTYERVTEEALRHMRNYFAGCEKIADSEYRLGGGFVVKADYYDVGMRTCVGHFATDNTVTIIPKAFLDRPYVNMPPVRPGPTLSELFLARRAEKKAEEQKKREQSEQLDLYLDEVKANQGAAPKKIRRRAITVDKPSTVKRRAITKKVVRRRVVIK